MASEIADGAHSLAIKPAPAFDFSIVSPAILELITEYLTGYDIISLYLTCSRALFIRLKAGGVRRFDISRNLAVPKWDYSKWACLSQYSHLHTISILHPSLFVWTRGWTIFKYLPKSVKDLSFYLPVHVGDFLLVADLVTPSSSAVNLGNGRHVYLTKRFEKKPRQAEVQRFPDFDIASRLPLLKRLRLLSLVDTNNNFPRWSWNSRHAAIQRFLESLPSGIVSLEVHGVCPQFAVDTQAASGSPSTQELESPISGATTRAGINGALHFPFLQHLELLTARHVPVPEDYYRQVPSHVSSLVLTSDPYYNPLSKFAVPTLERLQWTACIRPYRSNPSPSPLWDGLCNFTSLVHLEIDILALSSFSGTRSELFSQLPRGLKTLKFAFVQSVMLIFEQLPLTLTDITLDFEHPLERPLELLPNSPPRFPASVRSLRLCRRFPLTTEDFSQLPRDLKSLDVNLAEELWDDACATSLPVTLTELKISHSAFGTLFCQQLPSTIHTLHLGTTHTMLPGDLSHLPESLTYLYLNAPPVHAKALYYLPASLTKLSVTQGQNLDDESIARLPRSLRSLRIDCCRSLGDSCVPHLPRDLTELRFSDNTNFTAMCAKYLPRSLSILELASIIMPHPRPSKASLLAELPSCLIADNLPWRNPKKRIVDFSKMQ